MKSCLFALGFLTLGVVPGVAGEKLNSKEIKAMFPGTYQGVYGKSTAFEVHGNANGTIRGIAEGKHDKGKWWVQGNRLCMAWTVWASGKSKCRVVEKRGAWFVGLNSKGKVKLKVRRK